MAANDREFTLIGRFDDQITKKLKELNLEIQKLAKPLPKDNFTKSMTDGLNSATKESRELQKQLEQVSKFKMNFDRSGIKAAQADVSQLGRQIEDVAKQGFAFDRSGLKAAQEDANVLGEILKANALIQVGEGFANALTAGATAAVNILQRGAGFFASQFRAAVQDQAEDLQARGSLFGALNKAGVLTGKTKEQQGEDYRQTKVISRANEQAIGSLIRTSSVSTSVVTTLNRQMTDNLLPSLLKARGITSLSGMSRTELDKTFGGKEGIGTELASVYEKMATIIPNPAYASMSAMGFTQAITAGTINRQLAVFENNPVLVDALKTIDGGIQGTADVGKRIQILKKALEIAAPTMMLDEMKSTISGGLQAVQDTIMNPTVGILSLGADVAEEGKKTLQQFKDSGAHKLKLDRERKNLERIADKRNLEGDKRKAFIAENMKVLTEKLNDALESADSPIEKISVSLGPLLQSFAGFLNTFGNLFLGPVTSAMNALYEPFAQLEVTLDRLSTDVDKGKRSIGEALGRAVAEFFKAISNYFNPEKAGEEIGGGINKFFADFQKGFKSGDGERFMKIVLDTLQSIVMKLIFNEGKVTKGLTGLGDALVKVFALLAAPAFVSALISGLVPLAVLSLGSLLGKLFQAIGKPMATSLGEKVKTLLASIGKQIENLRSRAPAAAAPPSLGSGALRYSGPMPARKTIPAASPSKWWKYSGTGFDKLPSPKQILSGSRTALVRGASGVVNATKGTIGALKTPIATLRSGLTSVAGPMSKFGSEFKSFFGGTLGKLAIFGSIITSIVSLLEGKDLASSLAEGAGPLIGSAIGGAIGTLLVPILGPLGPLLGSMLGGWIGSLEPVVSFITGIFQGLGSIIGTVGQSFSEIFGTIVAIATDMWSILTNIIPGMSQLGEGFSFLRAGVLAINIALFPLTATLDLVNVALQLLRIAFLQIQLWASKLPFVGGAAGDPSQIESNLREASSRLVKTIDDNSKKYSWDQFSGANLESAAAARRAGQSMTEVAGSAKSASQQLSRVNAPVPTPPGSSTPGAKTGLTPTAAQMDWYNRAMEQSNAKVAPPKPTPIAPLDVAPLQGSVSSASSTIQTFTKANQTAAIAQLSFLQRAEAARQQQLGLEGSMRSGWARVNVGSQQSLFSSASNLASSINSAANKIKVAGNSLPGTGGGGTPGVLAAPSAQGHIPGKPVRGMSLADAINYEMKNKPPGSSLVIANSSETIIPAAEGYSPGNGPLSVIGQSLGRFLQPLENLGKMADKLSGTFGGLLGLGSGGAAGVDAFNAIARKFGLIITSSYRPGDPGWHGANRARDYSNSTGPTPQMMEFARFMVSNYGRNLKELIYTPLGFSIKNGAVTRPLAAGSHYNHVHVAYALGAGNPAFFSSRLAAESWERKMIPATLKPKTITTNTGESFSGGPTINAPITIYQQPYQNAEQLAEVVAMRIAMAVDEARNHM